MDFGNPCNCPLPYEPPRLAEFCGGADYITFMGVVEMYIRMRCDIVARCYQPGKPNVKSRYDFIVVGAGMAGSVVASRLTEVANFTVLLIEAGDVAASYTRVPALYPASIFSTADYKYFGTPQKNCFGSSNGIPFYSRGMMTGGTGNMNAMNYQRGSLIGYENTNDEFRLDQWSYSDCLPYFKKSEDNLNIGDGLEEKYHGVGGLQPVSRMLYLPPIADDILKASQYMGYDIVDTNGRSQTGFTKGQTFTKLGVSYSTFDSFIRPVLKRKNLDILLNSTVGKINLKGNHAESVDIIHRDGKKETIFCNKEIIVCAGTIGSAQLLQLSGIGPRDVLTKAGIEVKLELGGVGENFHDHVRSNIQFTINELATNPLTEDALKRYYRSNDGPLSSTGLHSVMGFINTDYADPRDFNNHPDGQLMFTAYLPTCSKTGKPDELEASAGPDKKRRITIWSVITKPQSRGTVKIVKNDPFAHPEIDGNYLTHVRDIKVLKAVMKEGLRLTTQIPLKKYNFTFLNNGVGCEKFDWKTQTNEYLDCHARYFTFTEDHMVGTCRMGRLRDPKAVVDKYLQVIGLRNLRVADASVFAVIPTGNIAAPTMMVAERAADFIKKKWLGGGCDEDDDNCKGGGGGGGGGGDGGGGDGGGGGGGCEDGDDNCNGGGGGGGGDGGGGDCEDDNPGSGDSNKGGGGKNGGDDDCEEN